MSENKDEVKQCVELFKKADEERKILSAETWEVISKMKSLKEFLTPVMRVEMKLNKIGIPKREVTEFYLKEIGRVERNDKWFDNQMEKLLEFHKEIIKLKNQK